MSKDKIWPWSNDDIWAAEEEWLSTHSGPEEIPEVTGEDVLDFMMYPGATEEFAKFVAERTTRVGDHRLLAEYLKAGYRITPELRNLIVQILEGKLKRPPNRPASFGTSSQRLDMALKAAERLATEKGVPKKQILGEVAARYGYDKPNSGTTVVRAMKEYSEEIRRHLADRGRS
jgi:hypothetical protein